jgi:hypothetical protein
MPCCGQKREALKSDGRPATRAATPLINNVVPSPRESQDASGRGVDPAASQRVRYLEKSPVLVRGPATGRPYEFSAARPVQPVDSRDAGPLLRTRFFSRA